MQHIGQKIYKIRYFLLICFCLISGYLPAQNLHSPSEVRYIMERSTLKYLFIVETIPTPSTTTQSSSTAKPEAIPSPSLNEKNRKKGEVCLKKKKWQKAAASFEKALSKSPNDAELYALLARAHAGAANWKVALQYIEKALLLDWSNAAANLLHYEILSAQKENIEALRAMTRAHLLSRTDQNLRQKMATAYAQNGLQHSLWNVLPSFVLRQTNDTIYISVISLHDHWASYAAVQALWQYEPTYSHKMQQLSNEPVAVIREKESLINAAITYELKRQKNELPQLPELELLIKAVKQKYLTEFVYYERIIPTDGNCLRDFTRDRFEQLVEYVLFFRDGRQ